MSASLTQFLVDVTRGPKADGFTENPEVLIAGSGLDEALCRALRDHDLAALWRAGAHPMALLYFGRKIGWEAPRYYACITEASKDQPKSAYCIQYFKGNIMTHYVISLRERPWEEWRPGVMTRSWSGEVDGASQVRVGEQIFKPGAGVPEHFHTYEEHILVLDGALKLEVDGETHVVEAPACVIFPPFTKHSFGCSGDTPVHIYGALGAPIHESFFSAFPEGQAIREYEANEAAGARRRVHVDPVTKTVREVPDE